MRTMTKRPRSIDCDFKRTWEKSPMSIPSHRSFVLREKKRELPLSRFICVLPYYPLL